MGTTRSFSTMLNEYLPNELLKEEMVKRDWILQNVEKDNSWKGGNLIVPFKAAGASSVAFGALTGSTDIAEDSYVRGSISTQPEVWGSMIFNHRDLMEHDKLSEQNFLKLLPDTVEDFLSYMKQCVSLNMLNGSIFSVVTDSSNGATGLMIVDRPERFTIGQKVVLSDDDTAASSPTGDYYVTAININSAQITLSATRGGGAANVSAYTVAQNAKFQFVGSASGGLTSLKASLLASANSSGGVSGGTTLYGQTKTAYPYLQSINVSGSGVNGSNILDSIFDAFTTIKNRGRGNPNKVIMSYKLLGAVMKLLETNKGAYHQDQKGTRANVYGWTEIDITGVAGVLTVVGIQEMNDDAIFFLDMRALKFYSNGFFRKRVSPDGIEYFESRATTGYTYIVDTCLFGDLVLLRPSYCGILYGIPSI